MLALTLGLAAMAAMDPIFQPAVPGFPEAPPSAEASIIQDQLGPMLKGTIGGSVVSGSTALGSLEAGVDTGWRGKWIGVRLVSSGRFSRGAVDADGSGHLDLQERRTPWVETARRLEGDLRVDHRFGDRNMVYGVVGALTDPFGGYALRTHEQVGVGRRLVEAGATDLVVETGVDVAQERYVDTVESDDAEVIAARAWVGLAHRFERVGWRQTFEVFENLRDREDLRLLHGAAFVAPLGEHIALEPTHLLAWDNRPIEGYAAVDQTTLLRLVATLE